ncbi:NUDIX hydrolase [Rhodopirellula sp. JC740]|uniref:GDP-mannose pyrophosphatase n=1 Tax=Rhodopirellula halodulae TaxID=2894198 RepID=A0ABS8ND88_9BACT|nr:NUDIX hydrolase [Rhodopirellula sp. JC740]MCC9641504.1 NUDIX hydrolase [Rhodopirellula sp. JC740]
MSNHEVLLRGSRFDVVAIDLPGRDGKSHRREFIQHPGAVVLLPLIDQDTVVMIENERPAVGETLLELPAGTRDPGEEVLETAARELTEETGFRSGCLSIACEFYSAPGLGDELMHLVVARDLTEGEQQLETTERIEVKRMHRREVTELVQTGKIRDAKTLIGLQAFLFQDV